MDIANSDDLKVTEIEKVIEKINEILSHSKETNKNEKRNVK